MPDAPRERGAALVALVAVLATALLATLAMAIARSATGPGRAALTDHALATAREALVAHATARPLDEVVGPGYLPCPDLDDDGWAEPTCGSLTGETGQWQRLGRLPWKTLGLPDLRDASGERLWYAVSSKHKGLLNCTVSPACLDMGPEAALGTITVRDAFGTVLHDGTSSSPYEPGRGGAVAVVIAPGPPLARWTGNGPASAMQSRTCDGGRCNASGRCLTEPPTLTPKCDPVNYLDRAPGPAFSDEDNARFTDRNDSAGRPSNRDGFVPGPVAGHDGTRWVNDRVAAVSYDDLMPRVMRRVAQEVALCLRAYAARGENRGRLPWAAPLCRAHHPDAAVRGSDAHGVRFGRVPDTPFLATVAASGATMLARWEPGCRIADAAGNTAGTAGPAWWSAWKRHVFYALEPGGRRFAVLVAGPPLDLGTRRQSRGAAADADAGEWLEEANAQLRHLNANPEAPDCAPEPGAAAEAAAPSFDRLAGPASRRRNDVIVLGP
jgi:hypothetical protein